MPGFYIECYTELKWVKGEYSLPQITAKGIFIDRIRNWSENSKPFWRQRFGRRLVVCPPSNAKRLRDIQHSMSMVIDTRFHIWFIMTILLQDATEVYYKMHQVLYYKMWQFYYKLQQCTDKNNFFDYFTVIFCLESLITEPSWFKSQNPTIIGLILTNYRDSAGSWCIRS